MSSPSQRHGGCGHMMAGFDQYSVCAHCREKKKGQDPCVENPDSDCFHCNALSPDQLAQLFTPSYKLKKGEERGQVVYPIKRTFYRHSQCDPCGPGTCVGSGGRGWPGHL